MDAPYNYVVSADRLSQIAREISDARWVALDTETVGMDPMDPACRIRLLSVNTGKSVHVIDCDKIQTPQREFLGPVGLALNNLEAKTGAGRPVIVGQNLKYDQKFLLHKHGIELWPLFDTYRSSVVIHNGRSLGHDLYELYRRVLQKEDHVEEMGASDWSVPELSKKQLDYAAEDVTYLPALYERLRAQLQANSLLKAAFIEFGVILPEVEAELNGFPIDIEAWLKIAEENTASRDQLKGELLKELPDPAPQIGLFGNTFNSLNLESPAQLLQSLRGLGAKLDGGSITSTDDTTLAMIADSFPVARKIQKYREYSTLVKMFGPEWANLVKKGRIHTNYYGFLVSGRFSCKPNIQQIPRDKRFRRCFRTESGLIFVICDYAAAQIRIAAEISKDQAFKAIFEQDLDPHSATASLTSGKPIDQITKPERQAAKALNFGLLFAMGPDKLRIYAKTQYGVDMTIGEAKDFHRRFFETYRGLKAWQESVVSDEHRRKGVSRTLSGRLRYVNPEQYSEFMNTPVQGSEADSLKVSMRNIYFALRPFRRKVRFVHHAHDEMILEAVNEPEVVEEAKHVLEKAMRDGMSEFLKTVKVRADASAGLTWADKA